MSNLMLNSNYLLPNELLEPYFYNDFLSIEQIPLFNELKKNYFLIKEELINNFNNMKKVTTNDFLYVNLDDYVISKSNNKPAKENISGYAMFINDFIKIYISKKNIGNLKNEIDEILKIENNIKINQQLSPFMLSIIDKSEKEITKEDIEKLKLIQKVKEFCPITFDLIYKLRQDGIMTNCFVSCLKGDSYIKAHNDYLDKTTIRIHYCLITDKNCKLTVGKETREWQENDFLIFDANGQYKHGIDHSGTNDRVVMIFDLKKDYLRKFKKK